MINAEIDVMERPVSEQEPHLKELFLKVMKQHGVNNIHDTEWLDVDSVDVTKLPAPAVHDFVLEAESLDIP